jgi:3-hydroxyisobutyrate dehydrogenase
MKRIAWLGTGMMGAAFVEGLRERGDDVVVWNRTRERAERLRDVGAVVAGTPREAVKDAELIHAMLADDASVDRVLDDLAGHIPPGATFIDHTTVAPGPTKARFARSAREGIAFLHAPVFMSPPMAREGKGAMLCSGPGATFERVREELAAMAADLWYLGERVDKAAALKLCGNQMLFFVVAGLADTFALGRASALTPPEVMELFAHFHPAGSIEGRGPKMARGDFSATFELTMARKDARLMLDTAAEGGGALRVLPRIVAEFDAALARGEGASDFSVIAKDAVTAPA